MAEAKENREHGDGECGEKVDDTGVEECHHQHAHRTVRIDRHPLFDLAMLVPQGVIGQDGWQRPDTVCELRREPAEGFLLYLGSAVDCTAERCKEDDHDWNCEKKHQRRFPGQKGDSCRCEEGADAQHVLRRAVADDEAGERVGIALQASNQCARGFHADARRRLSQKCILQRGSQPVDDEVLGFCCAKFGEEASTAREGEADERTGQRYHIESTVYDQAPREYRKRS